MPQRTKHAKSRNENIFNFFKTLYVNSMCLHAKAVQLFPSVLSSGGRIKLWKWVNNHMIARFHDDHVIHVFRDYLYYSECKSKLKWTVEKGRRVGETALLLPLFPAPAHIRERQKQVSASPKPLGRCATPWHAGRGLLQGPQGNLCRLLSSHTWMLPL